jgi:hypothetical protein
VALAKITERRGMPKPKESEDYFSGLHAIVRGALESFDRTSSIEKQERSARAARHFLSEAATTSQNSYTFFSRLYDSLAGLSFLTVFRSKKGLYVTGLKLEPLGEIAMWRRSTTLRQMLPEFSDFFV